MKASYLPIETCQHLSSAFALENINLPVSTLSQVQIFFVDKLPAQPWGDFCGKVWGKRAVYFRKDRVANLSDLKARNPKWLCHELVHVWQIEHMGWSGFLLAYIWGWVSRGFRYRKIPLEVEAYELDTKITEHWTRLSGGAR